MQWLDRSVQRRLSSVLFLLITALLFGCHGSRREENRVHFLVAGSAGNLSYLPHLFAQELGYYRQEGIEAQVDFVPGGSKAMEALLGGSADVIVGYYEHSIRVAAQGRGVRSFALMTRYPGNVLIVSPSAKRKIERIEDLKGATVGVPDPGSQAHLLVNYLLARKGLTPSDITVVTVGNNAGGVAAFEHGKMDVWAGFDPGITQVLRRHPEARILVDVRGQQGVRDTFGTDMYPGAVLYTTAGWLEQHPGTARRVAKALVRSLHWIREHSPEDIASKVPASLQGGDTALYLDVLRGAMPMYSGDGLMTAEAASVALRTLEVSLESVRSAKIDLSKTYTNEFVGGSQSLHVP